MEKILLGNENPIREKKMGLVVSLNATTSLFTSGLSFQLAKTRMHGTVISSRSWLALVKLAWLFSLKRPTNPRDAWF
jgi:hypothetical protein